MRVALFALCHQGVETYMMVGVDEEIGRRLCADSCAWFDREGRAAGLEVGIHGCLGVDASAVDHVSFF